MADIGKPKRKIRIDPEPRREPAQPERVEPKREKEPAKVPARSN